MTNRSLARKQPRDFVFLDEFWPADESWPHYYIGSQVWIYLDEYRAELAGDEDYCRIIVNAGNDRGWIYKRRLSDKQAVLGALEEIDKPVSEAQLERIGFTRWAESHIY